MGQGAVSIHQRDEFVQLFPGGEVAKEEEIGGFLKAKPIFGHKATDQILHVNAPVEQLALHGDPFTVLHVITPDIADLGDAGHDTGAIRIAQAALYFNFFVAGGINQVMFCVFAT